MILEHLGFNKYRVKVDGSGRITERNRQFLKKFTPVTPALPGPNPNASYFDPHVNPIPHQPVVNPIPTPDLVNTPALSPPSSPPPQLRDPPSTPRSPPESPTFMTPPSSPSEPVNNNPEAICIPPNPVPVTLPTPEPQVVVPRRSTRIRIPTKRYNPASMISHRLLLSMFSISAIFIYLLLFIMCYSEEQSKQEAL